jgi:hypothetical protein
MTFVAGLAAALILLVQTPLNAWTWTLYEDTGAVVLAHEVPDTAQLRATFECEPGSGAVEVVLYEFGAVAEFAQLRAGTATATSEAERGANRSIRVGLRIDHPGFAAFASSGRLTVSSGERSATVTVDRANLAKLRRFGELCAG